jgi:hypothetical protein
MSYLEGNVMRSTGRFYNTADALIDPQNVFFVYIKPSGELTTRQYGVHADVVRTSTGVYYCEFTLDSGGIWRYRWYSTGTGVANNESSFEVTETTVE